jgi:hypothetical protein
MESDCKTALKELQKQLWAAWDAFFLAPNINQPSAMSQYRELLAQNKDLMKRCKR